MPHNGGPRSGLSAICPACEGAVDATSDLQALDALVPGDLLRLTCPNCGLPVEVRAPGGIEAPGRGWADTLNRRRATEFSPTSPVRRAE